MVEKGPFVMRTIALYFGRTDTTSEGSETLKLSSNWEALMMLLLKLFWRLDNPCKRRVSPWQH